jgi:hypothetical protein
MAGTDRSFANSHIRFDAYVRGPEETGICVFVIERGEEQTLFEVSFQFAGNGNDFRVVVSNFGLKNKALAGSRSTVAQHKFNCTEIASVRRRLEEYFSGPEEKNYSPFKSSKAHFLGIGFPDGWKVEE